MYENHRLNGKNLEVTDLDKAIKQAQIFKDYEHESKDFKDLDNTHKSYWNDMYHKLQILKIIKMSILSKKTEYKAMYIIGDIIKRFENLHLLNMTRQDDEDLTKARNSLETIIHSNGYKINYDENSKKSILKDKQNEY